MAHLVALEELKNVLTGRLWAARYRIRTAEEQYLAMDFEQCRNIHLQGPKARFLLAGLLQHQPSKNMFKKVFHYDSDARGPGELCPVIDAFEDVREAMVICDEWVRRPQDHTIAHVKAHITKAEKVAQNIQILLETMKRGGDQTPPLVAGSETLDEFCERVEKHHIMVCSMTDGYDGRWAEVPSNDTPLSSRQVADNWTEVCRILLVKNETLEKALEEARAASRNMEYQELAWEDQRRVWFGWVPKLGAEA